MLDRIMAVAENSEGGIAAVIAAIAALITAVFAGIYKLVQGYEGSNDKTRDASLAVMAASRDDALAGEERMIQERDDARRETAAANRRADRWMERAQAAELKLARLRTTGATDDA